MHRGGKALVAGSAKGCRVTLMAGVTITLDYDLTERQTRQIVEALRSGKSGGIADLIEPAKPRGAPVGNQNAAKGEENKGNNVTFESTNQAKRGTRADYFIARLKRDAASDPHAEALLGKVYRQPASDRKKPSTATLPLERGEVLAKGG